VYRGSEDNLSAHLIDQVNAHVIDLLRTSGGIRRDILTMLSALEDDITGKLARITSRNNINAARLRMLLAQVKDTIRTAYGDISKSHLAALGKVAQASASHIGLSVNNKIKVPIIDVSFTQAQLKALASNTFISGRYADEWWARQGAELLARFQVQMRLGMLQGEGIGDLVRRVRGTREAGFTDGLMRIPTAQAETLVRTSVIAVANAARLESFMQNKSLIKGIQWVSTLDSRTTEICIALDSKAWELPPSGDIADYGGYKPIAHDKNFPGPTAHWGCRSTQIPVLYSFDEMKGPNAWKAKEGGGKPLKDFFQQRLVGKGFTEKEAAKIEISTRASMDGQVGVDNGYEKWLNGKSNSFQNDLLGETAAKLWRQGKLGLSDITNQDNRPLSAEELLKKVKA